MVSPSPRCFRAPTKWFRHSSIDHSSTEGKQPPLSAATHFRHPNRYPETLTHYWLPEFNGICIMHLEDISFSFSPIRESSRTVLERDLLKTVVAVAARAPTPVASNPSSIRPWLGGEERWTSEAGWGCILQSGQSWLSTAFYVYT